MLRRASTSPTLKADKELEYNEGEQPEGDRDNFLYKITATMLNKTDCWWQFSITVTSLRKAVMS
jgi:hypothetical protein